MGLTLTKEQIKKLGDKKKAVVDGGKSIKK